MTEDVIVRRVLGGIRFLDATTALPVQQPLAVSGREARLVCNRRGLYVIARAPGLEPYTSSFPPPAAPPAGSVRVELQVVDPSRVYLPRRFIVRLPRDADPGHAANADWLFRPLDVTLFPSPVAGVSSGWAVIRAHVGRGASPTTAVAAPGALIRVLRSADNVVLARGMADNRGEALVGVPGVPVTTWGDVDEPVLVTEIDVSLNVVFDPDAGPVPDPDEIEARRATLPSSSTPARLASGRVLTTTLLVPPSV